MFNLKFAKSIILNKNEDGTYNMIVKTNVYETNGITVSSEVKINYPRVKIIDFNIEALANNETIYEVKM
jgi:hypothetical protein